MKKVNYNEHFTVTMEFKQGTILGYHLLETWRSNVHGGIDRPADLPPLVAYDPETGRRIYRAWPNKDGSLVKRENNKPAEIFETKDQPHMMWYNTIGEQTFIARPSKIKHDPQTGEIVECLYESSPIPCSSDCVDEEPPTLDL